MLYGGNPRRNGGESMKEETREHLQEILEAVYLFFISLITIEY